MSAFCISADDAMKYRALFNDLSAKAGGVATLDKSSAGLSASGLPVDALMKIWTLSDLDGDDRLNLNEYCICCALIAGCVHGNGSPPDSLPAVLLNSDWFEPSGDDQAKRARPSAPCASSATSASVVPAWSPPSATQLYAAGLENKAEAVSTSASWSIDGNAWRAANFSGADTNQATLKQRQAEARRMLLRK